MKWPDAFWMVCLQDNFEWQLKLERGTADSPGVDPICHFLPDALGIIARNFQISFL